MLKFPSLQNRVDIAKATLGNISCVSCASSLDIPKSLELVGMAKTVPEASSQFNKIDNQVV